MLPITSLFNRQLIFDCCFMRNQRRRTVYAGMSMSDHTGVILSCSNNKDESKIYQYLNVDAFTQIAVFERKLICLGTKSNMSDTLHELDILTGEFTDIDIDYKLKYASFPYDVRRQHFGIDTDATYTLSHLYVSAKQLYILGSTAVGIPFVAVLDRSYELVALHILTTSKLVSATACGLAVHNKSIIVACNIADIPYDHGVIITIPKKGEPYIWNISLDYQCKKFDCVTFEDLTIHDDKLILVGAVRSMSVISGFLAEYTFDSDVLNFKVDDTSITSSFMSVVSSTTGITLAGKYASKHNRHIGIGPLKGDKIELAQVDVTTGILSSIAIDNTTLIGAGWTIDNTYNERSFKVDTHTKELSADQDKHKIKFVDYSCDIKYMPIDET